MTADPIGLGGGTNLYAYVRNDPVNAVDPWGLAEYTGELTFTGVGYWIVGAMSVTGTLSTKCVEGKKLVGEVAAMFAGADVSYFLLSSTSSKVIFEDSATGRGDLNNLSGLSSLTIGSFAIFKWGISVFDIQLGQARSVEGGGSQTGFDPGGLTAMGGWSIVGDIREVCCD